MRLGQPETGHSGYDNIADIRTFVQTRRMFEPLFPVVLLCGPLALAVFLRIEANRNTCSIWPQPTNVLLALAGMWGLTDWVLMLGVVLFGEGMREGSFDLLIAVSIFASVAFVTGGYWFVSRHRMQDVPR